MLLMLQITAAQGPAECERAVALTLRAMVRDAAAHGVDLQMLEENATPAGFKSVLLRMEGDSSETIDAWLPTWEGSVQCVFTSPFRPGHKRKNWFVGVERCAMPEPGEPNGVQIDERDMLYQACRASGKGGQHVNTTDSAVHATHQPSGISVKVMTERSQHANKRLARALIAMKLAERAEQSLGAARRALSEQHWALVRGNPVRVLKGL